MHWSRILGVLVCVSVALVGAPAFAIAQGSTVQDAKTGISDSWLTAKAKIELFADERIKGGQISVETVKGVVSLRGKVDSEEARAAAGSIAETVDGVKSVRNDLEVVSPDDRRTVDTSDKDITRQVEGRLSNDAQFRKVDVRTDSGVVILTGAVSSIGASARASELARGVAGVRLVKNELAYDAGKRGGARVRTAGSSAQVIAIQQAHKGSASADGERGMGPRTAAALVLMALRDGATLHGR